LPSEENEHLGERVAFVGQVPVKVRGPVHAGDYIVPSGLNDGTGVVVPPEAMRPVHSTEIVGIAWESSEVKDIKLINMAIGLQSNYGWVGTILKAQQQQITVLQQQNAELRERLTALEQLAQELSKR
jgi:hypothetical protein